MQVSIILKYFVKIHLKIRKYNKKYETGEDRPTFFLTVS